MSEGEREREEGRLEGRREKSTGMDVERGRGVYMIVESRKNSRRKWTLYALGAREGEKNSISLTVCKYYVAVLQRKLKLVCILVKDIFVSMPPSKEMATEPTHLVYGCQCTDAQCFWLVSVVWAAVLARHVYSLTPPPLCEIRVNV